MRRNILLISVFLIFGLSAGSQKTQLLHFYVEAVAYQRINTPVCINLEGINISETLSYTLFEAYRYGGGIGFRATEEWTRENSTTLTSEGKTRVVADSIRSRWTNT